MLPLLVKHLLFPLHERLMRRPTFSYLAELEQSQWWSPERLESLQMHRLKSLLQSALAHSPWHAERIRAAGIDPNGPVAIDLEQFRRLPTMHKADATAHRDQLVWKQAPGGVQLYNTGGSSGQPLIFFYGRKRQAADAACRMRAHRWWGVEVGAREVYLWGSPVELNKTDRIKTLRDRIFNQLLLNAFEMSESRMDDYLDRIETFDPACIYGYASSLNLLSAHAQRRRRTLRLPDLKVVCTTGDPLFPEYRERIGAVFGVPVANEYGCRDGGLIALESPEGQMLVNDESILLEILDLNDKSVAPGDIGEAVVTNLCSEAQPFLRYRTGDMLRRSTETCRGGRGLRVIGEIMGRSTDFVVRSDGAIMHALALIYVLRAIEGVGEFKIIQRAVDHLEVLVCANHEWREEAEQRIVEGLRQRMGDMVSVDVRRVERIAPEASGKHRYVVSQVALPGKW